ncbi:MAG: putative membrane protein [Yoonia sp.]|jgi:putative membrane protein
MIATILILLVALIHAYFLVLEMFRWETPRTRKVLGTTAEFAAQSRAMAANQGLYNGFLAAGLIYGLVLLGRQAATLVGFMLLCVVVAGIYGAVTVTKAAFVAQTIPAALAVIAIFLNI